MGITTLLFVAAPSKQASKQARGDTRPRASQHIYSLLRQASKQASKQGEILGRGLHNTFIRCCAKQASKQASKGRYWAAGFTSFWIFLVGGNQNKNHERRL